jgi:GNAT superfamily N-acetyltransferase
MAVKKTSKDTGEMQPRSNSIRSRIRRSTKEDLYAIHAWLLDQDARNVPGTFLCNWELTKKQHENGKLLVYFDGTSGQAVAYQWGGLVHPGILEVRQDMRGKGIASKLICHRIRQAYRRNQCILVIQCKPSSSIQFWQRMGFILFDSKMGENFAYRILQKKLRLPSNGLKIDVAIRFFPEERRRDKKISAYSVATPNALQTSDGIIHLAERVLFFEELYPDPNDMVIEVEVANQIRFCDKAKYREARDIGVQRCDHGFYIDCVLPNPPSPT